MKIKMFALFAGLALTGSLFATAQTVTTSVTSLYITGGGNIHVQLDTPHNNPDGCDVDNVVVLSSNLAAYKAVYSLLLMARSTVGVVTIDTDHCTNSQSQSYPEILNIAY